MIPNITIFNNFLTILLNLSHLFPHSININSYIWPIDGTLSGATTLD